jgi:hypothetical protein
MTIIDFSIQPRIERELEKLELIHQEMDALYDAMEEVEERLRKQQEIFDTLLLHWKDPVPVLWKLYATNQKLSLEDFE